MKFYSEKLDKVFDTEEELRTAEESTDCLAKEDCCKSCSECSCENEVKKPSKKQLASDVDDAEAKLSAAYADYEVAKKQVEELSKTYLESVNAILEPAKEAVKSAEEARYEAIKKFNESFGAYQTVLTGDRAAKELVRTMNEINSFQRKFFNHAFWF